MLSLRGRDSASSEMLHDATDYRLTEDSRFRGAFLLRLIGYWLKSREHDDCSGSSALAFRPRLWPDSQHSDWSYI